MAHNTLRELLDDIKTEDTAVYLELINKINSEKLDVYDIKSLLMDSYYFNGLTDNQFELLLSLRYLNGDKLQLGYGTPKRSDKLHTRQAKIAVTINLSYYNTSLDLVINEEDLKYVTTYYKSKWRQVNPSTTKRKVRGAEFTFNMDLFSLNIFKNNIKPKGFLRTEAKTLVMKVNKAFDTSAKTANEISIRNRFYALILDNTKVHTKAMLNTLQSTELTDYDRTNNTISYTYIPHEEEAIVIDLGWQNRELRSVNTPDAHETYSSDVTICTHMRDIGDSRVQMRALAAASCLTTLAFKLDSEVYANLATKMVSNFSEDTLIRAQELTESATKLNNIIKENK